MATRARILADYVSSGDELAVTTATADAALPKAGGAMTGAITTNSTFDGVDIAVRDAIHAPKASPAFTGTPTGITAAHITSGVLPVGVTGGSGLDKPTVVWAGWNSASDTTTGTRVNWPLDENTIALNTDYMTKSTNTFTCVKAGTYFVSFNTMSTLDDGEYIHHRMLRSGVHYIQGHSYGSGSAQRWQDFGWQVMIDVSASQTLSFDSWALAGVTVTWHGGTSYSQLSISYMHA